MSFDINLSSGDGNTLIGSSTPVSFSADGVLTINNTTASTSTTTGSLIISGGVGIVGALYADSATFTTLTVPHSGLSGLLNDDHTQYALLAGRSGGQIITGGTAASNVLTLRSTSNATKGQVYIDETTASTSTTTGALRVDGGVGIGGAFYTGTGTNLATISGITTIGSSTAATVSAAGVLTVANTTKIGSSNTFTGTGGGINTDGDITLSNATSNIIAFRDVGVGEPTFTTRNAGTKIVLRPGIGAASVDNAIGVSTFGETWFSVPNDTDGFIWYTGETTIMQLSGSGGSGLIIGDLGGLFVNLDLNGKIVCSGGISTNDTTDAISVIDGGAFTSAGGGAFEKKLFVGGDTNLATVSGITTIGSATPTTVSAAGVLTVVNTTASTTTTTGALKVAGGVGIAGALYANSGNFTTLTAPHSGLSGLLNDEHTQYTLLAGRSGGQIITGGTAASNLLTLRSTSNATKGRVHIDETTTSTSTVSGALTVAGGVGIAGTLYTGTGTNLATISGITTIGSSTAATVSAAGVLTVVNTTASTTTTTGALKVAGGVGIAGALYANSGNFTTLTAPHSGLSGLLNDEHTQYTLLAGRSGGQIITGGTAASNLLTLRSTSNATKGRVHIDETTTSTSTVSGALTVAGGVGIAGTLYIGTDTNLATISGITTIGSSTAATFSAAGVLTINNLTDSTSSTTGSLIVAGGIATNKSLFVGTKNLTPNTDDITSQVSFSGAQSASNSNVTGLLFNPVNTRSFEVLMTVVISATASLYSHFKLQAIYNGTSWYFSSSYIGDDTLVTFSITNAGQVTYSSSTYTGFSSLTMKFRANTIAI